MKDSTKNHLESLEKLFVGIIDNLDEEDGENLYATRSRDGIFAPALVMWLTMLQRLQQRQSLASALEGLSQGEGEIIRAKNPNQRPIRISLNTGGLCRARRRVPLSLVRKTCNSVSEAVMAEHNEAYRWRGRLVVLVDGTTIRLARSEKTLRSYGPICNQHGETHNPLMLCLCAHELSTGVAVSPVFGPYRGQKATSEQALYRELVKRLPKDCLVMGDRLYGRYPTVFWAHQQGHQVLVRLPVTLARKLLKERFGDEDVDLPVEWNGAASDKNGIPPDSKIAGRVIQHTVRRDGFRPMPLWFFTTSSEPTQDILAMYLQRERIENDIRSLKDVLELEMLSSKSPDVLEKELLLAYAAYNLMRSILSKAALKLGIQPRQISFSRAARLTRIFGNKLRDATSSRERDEIFEEYLRGLRQSKLPNRKKRRIEPRKCVFEKKKFPIMTGSRAEEREKALKVAQEKGHRGFMTTVSRKN